MKVKKYFEYLNEEQLEDNEAGDQMLNQLTGSLKRDVLLDIFGKIIKNEKIFKLNFSDQLLEELTLKMKEKRLAPEEIIYNQNEFTDKLFFLMKGSISFLIQKDGDSHPIKVKEISNE